MSGLILGFDLSLNSTGLCIYKDGSPYHYECIVPHPLKNIDRLYSNYLDYCRVFSTYRNISIIAYESQVNQMRYHNNAGSILGLAENIGVFKLAIAETALVYNPELIVLGIPPGDIKSFATGNSKSDKEAMINAVNGHHIKKIRANIPEYSVNDVVDAYHIARMAHSLSKENNYEKYVYEDYRKEVSLIGKDY